MQRYLRGLGLGEFKVKYLDKGSMRGTWALINTTDTWSKDVADELTKVGFTDIHGRGAVSEYSGTPISGGKGYQVFVGGHQEMLSEDGDKMVTSWCSMFRLQRKWWSHTV
jgi:hypothetical protein